MSGAQVGGTPTSLSSATARSAEGTGGTEHFDLETNALGLFFRALGALIAFVFVIPAPWIACWISGWFVSQIRVNGRPSLVFRGTPRSVAFLLLYPVVVGMNVFGEADDSPGMQGLAALAAIALSWALFRWLVNHAALAGRSLRFDGSVWIYIGGALFTCVSILTIIGWGWVLAAFYR